MLYRAPESDILHSIVNDYLERTVACRHGNPTAGLNTATVTE